MLNFNSEKYQLYCYPPQNSVLPSTKYVGCTTFRKEWNPNLFKQVPVKIPLQISIIHQLINYLLFILHFKEKIRGFVNIKKNHISSPQWNNLLLVFVFFFSGWLCQLYQAIKYLYSIACGDSANFSRLFQYCLLSGDTTIISTLPMLIAVIYKTYSSTQPT